jgi:DNA-binding response OmpR family regulator
MPSKKTSVLVVDDDIYVVRMMQRILDLEGYRVLKVGTGEAAIDMFIEENPDLMLLDIMMPVMDGYTVCEHIREFSQVPIIIVTAKGNEDEKIKGLDAGADDYLTKPFSSGELAARVRSVFRTEHYQPVFSSHDLTIDFTWHRVVLGDRVLDLTATEYRLLSYLVRNAGRVLTPDQILREVWGEDYVGEHHLLRVNMARLRHKMSDDSRRPRFIATKIGLGYMFIKPD